MARYRLLGPRLPGQPAYEVKPLPRPTEWPQPQAPARWRSFVCWLGERFGIPVILRVNSDQSGNWGEWHLAWRKDEF